MQNFTERVVSALSSGKVEFIEDLIRTKRAAGRLKDLAVLPVLDATLQMLQEKSGT